MADVEKLKEQKRQLEAKIKKIESLEKTKKRKEDTRRKIIVGGALLAQAEKDPAFKQNLYRHLEKLVINPKDRELVGLSDPQLSPSRSPSAAAAASAVAPETSNLGSFKIKEDTPL